MTRTRCHLALALVLCAPVWGQTAAPQVAVVNSGHRGAITGLAVDGAGLLFAASEDGVLSVWDTAARAPLGRLQVTHLPIRLLSVHPRLPYVAVVESDLSTTRLTVWDHRGGRRLFIRELDSLPTQLTFSSTGTYLVLTRDRYAGLLFVDPLTGEPLPLFTAGFGIVSYVTFSADDTRMMSYQPGGEVKYWDIATGRQRPPTIRTEAFLAPVTVSGSDDSPLALIAGFTGRQLVLADIAQNGAVRERLSLGGVVALTSSPRGDIALLSREGSGTSLVRYKYRPSAGLLRLRTDLADGAWGAPTTVAASGDELYVGTSSGTIVSWSPQGAARILSRDTLASVSDIAATRGHLLIAVGGAVLDFDTTPLAQVLTPAAREAEPPAVVVRRIGVGYAAPRFAVSERGEVWLWSATGEEGRLSRLEPTGYAEHLFPAPLRSVRFLGSEVFAVERTGRVSILSATSEAAGGLAEVFAYNAPGANAMVGTGRVALIGKTAFQAGDSSILLVDRLTGETVPLPAEDDLVYDLRMSPRGDGVLSVGVSSDGEERTTLRLHTGRQYLTSTEISVYRGEDTTADIVVSASRGEAYTSLGYALSREQPGGWKRQMFTTRSPRTLTIGDGYLASLNSDGTITIWDPGTLEPVLDLYVFADGEWLAMDTTGAYVASEGGARYLALGARGQATP